MFPLYPVLKFIFSDHKDNFIFGIQLTNQHNYDDHDYMETRNVFAESVIWNLSFPKSYRVKYLLEKACTSCDDKNELIDNT